MYGLILTYVLLTQYGTWLLMGVVEEKSSRVIEVLMSTLRAGQLLAGKVIGIGAVAMLQAALIVGVALGLGAAEGSSLIHGTAPLEVASSLLWVVLGYSFYCWVYAAGGSLADRQDQIQTLAFPLQLPILFGYIVSLTSLGAGQPSELIKVLAYVPFTAPFAMPVLVGLGDVMWWEFALSVGLMLASIVVVARLASAVYRRAILARTGGRVHLRQLFRLGRRLGALSAERLASPMAGAAGDEVDPNHKASRRRPGAAALGESATAPMATNEDTIHIAPTVGAVSREALVGTNPEEGSVLRLLLRISIVSLAWTLVVGVYAITLGVTTGALTLASFGAIGLLDAAGSATLVVHFRHALRHERISERHERTAARVVTLGMGGVGVGTLVVSVIRLLAHGVAPSSRAGVGLAAVSVLVLSVLAKRKHAIARQVPSGALRADGWLSAMGAVRAAVTLVGTGLTTTFGWWWLDPVAAMGIAGCAVGLSIALARARGPTRVGQSTGWRDRSEWRRVR